MQRINGLRPIIKKFKKDPKKAQKIKKKCKYGSDSDSSYDPDSS
jgi:hypothetical protein